MESANRPSHYNMRSEFMTSDIKSKLMSFLTSILFLLASITLFSTTVGAIELPPVNANQIHFATAKEAADKLHAVVLEKDTVAVKALFGEKFLYLLPLDEINGQDRELFLNSWKESHKLIAGKNNEMFIEVGTGGWTFPIPLVKDKDGKNGEAWYFDTLAGSEIVKTRRIGRNELSAIQASLAYYDAQKEYAEYDRNEDRVLEYAQQFVSTPGTKNGLYWSVEPGEVPSPLGLLFAINTADGAYHGYYYKILKSQGEKARGGAYSYMMGKYMKSGFALIAWPADYGSSGIMSFLISHDGVLYEKNLGIYTAKIAADMISFEPDDGWIRSEETP